MNQFHDIDEEGWKEMIEALKTYLWIKRGDKWVRIDEECPNCGYKYNNINDR